MGDARHLASEACSAHLVAEGHERGRPASRVTRDVVANLAGGQEQADRELGLRLHVEVNRVRHHKGAIRDCERWRPAECQSLH